jgi:hypothetical protein
LFSLDLAVAERLECGNIVVSDQGVFEVQGRKLIVAVMMPDIQRIRFAYTSGANRPVLEGVVGAILVVLGIKGVLLCWESMKGFRYYVVLVVLGVLGAAMLWDVIKRRYILHVIARDDTARKLSFATTTSFDDIQLFLERAKERFGLHIESDVRDREI